MKKVKLHFGTNGNGYEMGIYQNGDAPYIICPNYILKNGKRYLRVGKENSMSLQLFNRGGPISHLQKATVIISCSDSSVVITKKEATVNFEPGKRTALSLPFSIHCNKKPPADGSPCWLKFTTKIIFDGHEFSDEIVVPVFFNVPAFSKFTIEDGYKLKDTVFGLGNGNRIAEPGEKIMIYKDGHRTRLYTDDPYVETENELLADEALPAKWDDGYTLSSVIKISKTCPKGHIIEFLANYETKSFMPINRKVSWGKILVTVE